MSATQPGYLGTASPSYLMSHVLSEMSLYRHLEGILTVVSLLVLYSFVYKTNAQMCVFLKHVCFLAPLFLIFVFLFSVSTIKYSDSGAGMIAQWGGHLPCIHPTRV